MCVCVCVCVCVCCLVTKSCLTLLPHGLVDCQAFLSVGFFRQEYWSELPFPSPGDLPWPRNWTHISCISRQILYHLGTREVLVCVCLNVYIIMTRHSNGFIFPFLLCLSHISKWQKELLKKLLYSIIYYNERYVLKTNKKRKECLNSRWASLWNRMETWRPRLRTKPYIY